MNILMLVHRIPFPPDKGDKIRSFHQLKYFRDQGWKVHLCTFVDDPGDQKHVADLREFCETLAVFPFSPVRQKMAMVLALMQRRSLSVAAFYLHKAQRHFDQILAGYPIQAIFCFCAPMAEYVLRSSLHRQILLSRNRNDSTNPRLHGSTHPPRSIMDFVDVDSEKWALYADNASGFKSWVYGLENKRLAAYERHIVHAFEGSCVVSKAEAVLLSRVTGQSQKIQAIGNGVDLDYFSPHQENAFDFRSQPCRLVFCGQMDYFPNVDAMVWFVKEVFPKLEAAMESVRLSIVGARPSQEVQRLAQKDGIEVTGRVDDVRPYIEQAHISIAPIRIARGIQNKVLEAMAMSKPVVATEQAFEGLEARPGEDLMVTSANPEDFAQAVLRLWENPDKAFRIALSSRKRVEESYSWEARLAPLGRLLNPKSSYA